jgi:hypothetical protein
MSAIEDDAAHGKRLTARNSGNLCSTALASFDQIGKTTAVHAYATSTQN